MYAQQHGSATARLLLLMAILVAVSCDQLVDPPASAELRPGAAPLSSVGAPGLPDRYVVVLKPNTPNPRGLARDMVGPGGGRVHHVYEHAITGFAMTLPAPALNGIRNHPSVAYVAPDAMVQLIGAAPGALLEETQTDATWGLDRVDQRDLPLDGLYTYDATGAGVTAYIIDSGILAEHEEFGGRASLGADFVDDGLGGADCHGHGTHVAGTVGGSVHGVARDVDLVAVRVFGCETETPYSVVIAAVDWVTANAERPAVANMSLGGGYFEPVNEAVRNSIASGVVYAIAAGNDWGLDACEISPASTLEALTVGATTLADTRSGFSNIGPCLDLFAPGSGITSAWNTGTADLNTISGTSMATPHVAGVAALVLEGDPAASPAEVMDAIIGSATPGRVADAGDGSPDRLLFAGLTPVADGPVIGLQPSLLRFSILRGLDGSSLEAGELAPADGLDVRSGGVPAGKDLGGALSDGDATEAVILAAETAPVVLSNLGNQPLEWSGAADQPWLGVSPAGGSLEPAAATELMVTMDASVLPLGEHHGAIAIDDPAAANAPRAIDVSVSLYEVLELEPGVPVEGLGGAEGSRQFFRVRVPEGAGGLSVRTSGGTGDMDLFLRYGALPDLEAGLFDCVSASFSNDEYCMLPDPPAGDWFILLYGWLEYAGVTLLAEEAQAAPIIDLGPGQLWFEHLLDPETGALIAAGGTPDGASADRSRLLETGKAYGADDGVGLRSLATWQPVWLGNVGTAPLSWSASTDQPWLGIDPVEGALAPGDFTELAAAVQAEGLRLGEYHGTISVDDPAALNGPGVVDVTLSVSALDVLELGTPVDGLVGQGGSSRFFRVTVPDGLSALEVTTSGGTGDLDLFVRYGAPPDLSTGQLDCFSVNAANDEQCLIQGPPGGDWYVLLYAYMEYEGATLVAREGEPAPIMTVDPQFLLFQQLIDPGTGGLVAAAPPTGDRDAAQLQALRDATGKQFTGIRRNGAAPASFLPEQPVWLGNAGSATLDFTAATDQPWLRITPGTGALEPWEQIELTASVDATGLQPGYHLGSIALDDPAAPNSPQTVWVDLMVSELELLTLNVPLEGVAGDFDIGPRYYRVTLPEGATDLRVQTSGGTGDLDIFVRQGTPPDLWWWEFDCASWNIGNEEVCAFEDPAPGDWYVLVYPLEPFDGVTLLASATLAWSLEQLAIELDRLEDDGSLDPGVATSLRARVERAIESRDQGNLIATRALLDSFVRQVHGLQRSGRLGTETATLLLQAAEAVLAELTG